MFLDPFAVDGATITAAQLRQFYYETVKGGTGVAAADHLKVEALAGSPGMLGINPGVGSISVPERRESYQISNTAMSGDAVIEVPAAGSSGATRYVVIEVTDPEFNGQEPAVTPRLVSSLSGLGPHVELARFTLAPGAGFDVTTSIEDRRVVTNPQTHLAAWTVKPTSADLSPTGTGWRDWLRFAQSTTVPDWAGRVLLDLKGSGLVIRDQVWHGEVRVAIKVGGSVITTEPIVIREDATAGDDRFNLIVGDLVSIPADRTGQAEVWLQISRNEGTGRMEANHESTLQLSATYIQAAR